MFPWRSPGLRSRSPAATSSERPIERKEHPLTETLHSAWRYIDTGTADRYRGLCVVDSNTVWLGGCDGTVVRTADGGDSWVDVSPPNTAELQFRSIVGFDDLTAHAMACGPGEGARVYRTDNGGSSWHVSFQATDPELFLNTVAFLDPDTGLAVGDPIDGAFAIVRTSDGGRTWSLTGGASAPTALPGDGLFAASGSCLVTADGALWIGTGGAEHARVLRSTDGGSSWQSHETGLPSGVMTGIFGLAFADAERGIAVGGNHNDQGASRSAVALTTTGGQEWTIPTRAESRGLPCGFRSAAAFSPIDPNTIVVVGPGGSEYTTDGGGSWHALGDGFDAVEVAPDGSFWASGGHGRVARLELL